MADDDRDVDRVLDAQLASIDALACQLIDPDRSGPPVAEEALVCSMRLPKRSR